MKLMLRFWHLATWSKVVLLPMLFFGFLLTTNAQVYFGNLSGAAEATPNASPGVGSTIVTIAGTTMRVQASFSGLMAGTTVAHIHAATAAAGTGAAGVATTTPTFTGFPAGVTSGSYDRLYDMTLSSSYNASYITANGGTTASAFVAFKAALAAGKAYLNIHSSAFPSGEIRGFLLPCPTITVAVPDAFAMPAGVAPNTVYPAYAPASSLMLQASASGGAAPYAYSWSTGANTAGITVSPAIATTYTVMATDNNGCAGTTTKTVDVADVAGGKNGDKIVICHKNGNTLTVGIDGVADHIGHGDMLGACPLRVITRQNAATNGFADNNTMLSLQAAPNPSANYVNLTVRGQAGSFAQVTVYDMMGKKVEAKNSVPANSTLRLGGMYSPGFYLIEAIQGTERQSLKWLKSN